ncbi:putative beta-barrel porin [Flavobacteriaceae bacterium MAR_2010_72]|nr:putative beta-barrel porin [Flavobacteriaceae bacterium MAR_2010_72]
MNKQRFCLLIILGFYFGSVAQTPTLGRPVREGRVLDTTETRYDTKSRGVKNTEAKIQDYKIISVENDTTFLDTTLSIKKEYKFNYLRKDNFNLIQFSNIGQTYNTLSYGFENHQTQPLFGARARHFNYMELEDTYYYHVPTPLTELFFKTAFEQGQVLDAFFTVNTSEQFNFSIAYKGLRSLGKYQHILTSTGNFRFTTNYKTKNNRYHMRAHMVSQDLLNQENGGLKDSDLVNFESGNPDFLDRSVFDPNFENAESILRGKRFYIDHHYAIVSKTDSLSTNSLKIGNTINFEDKFYQFKQTTAATSYFGDTFNTSVNDKVTLEDFRLRGYLNYQNAILGDLQFNMDYHNFNYGYDKLVVLDNETIINRIKSSFIRVGGAYKKQIDDFQLIGELGLNLSDEFKGNFLKAQVSFKVNDDISVEGLINSNSSLPNYNYLLYQSDYVNYNWDNTDTFDNQTMQLVSFKFSSQKLLNIEVDYTTLGNYTFFTKDNNSGVKPVQSDATINYLRLKIGKGIKFGRFALDNTIMYQNVLNGDQQFNVPEIISRNTFYYSSHLFKKAMYLQTGVTLNYFTEYYMNAYDPLLAEFYVQNQTKLGGFPRLDFFIDAKIRQTRIYLKAEHFNSSFTGYNYYSAPNYPYRDFVVRFGLVWNFFL